MATNLDEVVALIAQEQDPFRKGELIRVANRLQGFKLKDIALKLNLNVSALSHYLRLHRLPDYIVDGYYGGIVSLGHLFTISRLRDNDLIKMVYEAILEKNLTVNQTESLLRQRLHNLDDRGRYLELSEIKEFTNLLERHYSNLKVKVVQSRRAGKIILISQGDLSKTTTQMRRIMQRILRELK